MVALGSAGAAGGGGMGWSAMAISDFSLLLTVKTQLCPGLVYLSLLLVISSKNVIGKDKIGVLSKPSIKPGVAEK